LAPFGQAVSEEKIFLTLANQKKELIWKYINIGPYGKKFNCLLFRNYKSDWIQTRQECSFDGPLHSLGFLFWYKMEDGGVIKNLHFVEDLLMIIPGQFGVNCPSGFREEAFWNIFPIGSNVKLSPAVAAILNFISEMAATAGLSLTLDPMGKVFQNASSLKPLG
jgi:hypothetical protein